MSSSSHAVIRGHASNRVPLSVSWSLRAATVKLVCGPLLPLDIQVSRSRLTSSYKALVAPTAWTMRYPILLFQTYLCDGLSLILLDRLLLTHGQDDFMPTASDHLEDLMERRRLQSVEHAPNMFTNEVYSKPPCDACDLIHGTQLSSIRR